MTGEFLSTDQCETLSVLYITFNKPLVVVVNGTKIIIDSHPGYMKLERLYEMAYHFKCGICCKNLE